MNTLSFRLKRRWDMTISAFQNDLHFSPSLALARLSGTLLGRIGFRKISSFFQNIKESYILNYLSEIFVPVVNKYKLVVHEGTKQDNAPVWICWWTGLDSAPQLVKQCVKSIQQNADGHPVNIITEQNWTRYIAIPSYIIEHVSKKKMGLAHLSDYIRISLLNQYGGLWLDATIFCTEKIPRSFFELPLFTCKSEYQECGYLSHMQWTTFCLGGWKGNVFFSFLKEAFEEYWKKNDYAIDYLFFDDLIFLAKENIPAIKQMLEAIPTNTPHRDDLQAAFNATLPAEDFGKVIHSDTPLYKLSWREKYSEFTQDGRESIYGYYQEQARKQGVVVDNAKKDH